MSSPDHWAMCPTTRSAPDVAGNANARSRHHFGIGSWVGATSVEPHPQVSLIAWSAAVGGAAGLVDALDVLIYRQYNRHEVLQGNGDVGISDLVPGPSAFRLGDDDPATPQTR